MGDGTGDSRAGPLRAFSPPQRAAIQAILDWYRDSATREFYLAGYAGTGKTTIASHLIRSMGLRTCVATFTGKAASVLRRKGVPEAGTIHSLIYARVPGSDPVRFELSPSSALADADILVIDEVSMVGDELANDLRSFGRKTLVLGDPGQLQPIRGSGAFTCREPDIMLTEIHRQAAGSPILALATAVREGKEWKDTASADAVTITPLTMSRVLEAWQRGSQVLCGTNRARRGITRRIREALGYCDAPVRVGERVICLKNDRDLGIYNGMLGTVVAADDENDGRIRLAVLMDDLGAVVEALADPTAFHDHYEGNRWEPRYERGVARYDFGYAITVHKAQGSEWPDVTVVDDSAAFREDARRWLYTAFTRAADRLTVLTR